MRAVGCNRRGKFVTRNFAVCALALAAFGAQAADGLDFKGELGLEGRYFVHDPVDERQTHGDLSLRLQPEWFADWNGGKTSATFSPFGRVDSADEERTHWDIREWYLRHRAGSFETRIGIRRVFWGATESVHLVDVINQTDLVENPDGEDKLGQPMLNLAWTHGSRTLDLFVLPYFRERVYPGIDGRLRPAGGQPPFELFRPYVSNDNASYESEDEERHLDWAARYAYSGGDLDLAVSHFSGTSRAPRLVCCELTGDGAELQPYYELIQRSGLDATLVAGGWLFKLEGIFQSSDIEDYAAAAGGFEYTLTGVFESAVDVGLLAEYLWDQRGDEAPTPFQQDIFVGTRIAVNDEASTELLAGAIVDADTQAVFANLEASRRIGEGFKLSLESRFFERAEPDDPSYFFRWDDYVSLELTYFF